MKMTNRGFLSVRPTKAFIAWAVQFEPDMDGFEPEDMEASIYLVEDDFFDIEPLIERNFKRIFMHELYAITDDQGAWPQTLSQEVFETFFEVSAGTIVIDLMESTIQSEDLALE